MLVHLIISATVGFVATRGYTPLPLHDAARAVMPRTCSIVVQMLEADSPEKSKELDASRRSDETGAFTPAAATGEDTPKTDGIPNYMLRDSGTIGRLADPKLQDDGVLYEEGHMVSIMTSDVIEMVQQQGGGAEKIDYLGENILVEGLLFDDFIANATFEISPQAGTLPGDGATDIVTLEVVEARASSALELSQLGDDDAKKQSVASFLSLAPGFAGWAARVVGPGRVAAGFSITKRKDDESADDSE